MPRWSQLGLHVIAKPTGPLCNLRCDYCFYLEKESLYGSQEKWRMSDTTLEAYVRQYIEAQPEGVGEIDFAFQGGEPTLLGVDFFRCVIELQQKYVPAGVRVHNSLQTNGILLDDSWCRFLREHSFLVGISLDGPADLHDKFRRDKQGRGTHARVVESIRRMQRHNVEFNALSCINRHNGDHAKRVYRHLCDLGITFMQFIPIVERLDVDATTSSTCAEELVSDRSVLPSQFGRFLIELFDQWVYNDVGRVFVRDFDQALAGVVGAGSSLCVYCEQCGRATAIEHNGDLFSCDHFVDDEHKLGNIHDTSIRELANSSRQEQFARDKQERLPSRCRECDYLALCNGACPKDRFVSSGDNEPPVNYLCEGFLAFFAHIKPTMKLMADELRARRPAAGVMRRLRAERQAQQRERSNGEAPLRRNSPCPCGSGRKFKACCMRR